MWKQNICVNAVDNDRNQKHKLGRDGEGEIQERSWLPFKMIRFITNKYFGSAEMDLNLM